MHNVRQQNRPPVPPGDLGPKQDHWREVGGREREVEGVGGGAERRAGGGRGGREGAERRARARARGGIARGGGEGEEGLGDTLSMPSIASLSKLWPVSESRVSAPARIDRPRLRRPFRTRATVTQRIDYTRYTYRSIRNQPSSRRYPCPLIARSFARSLARSRRGQSPTLTRGASRD